MKELRETWNHDCLCFDTGLARSLHSISRGFNPGCPPFVFRALYGDDHSSAHHNYLR